MLHCRVNRQLPALLILIHLAYPATAMRSVLPASGRAHTMSVDKAATQWDSALPTGNGRIGALVFGEIADETILLNHDSLFLRREKASVPRFAKHLPQVRKMTLAGRYDEAAEFLNEKMAADGTSYGSDSFHPAFNITVQMDNVGSIGNERRTVDFETGEVVVSWETGGVGYSRRLFVSRKDNAVVLAITASKPGALNCSVGLLPTGLKRSELGDGKNVRIPRFPHGRVAKIKLEEVPVTYDLDCGGKWLTLVGTYDTGGPHRFTGGQYGGCASVRVTGGTAETKDLRVHARNADEVLVICKLFANEPAGPAVKRLKAAVTAPGGGYDQLFRRHADVHGELFRRARLDLGGLDKYRRLSNEKLIAAAAKGKGLNAMFERLFDFGRYALICSSAVDGIPANLQGIWNGWYAPPWAADYHNDINIQMNYFQALAGNMAEITLCYFDYYESMLDDFRANAESIMGCRGIMAPMGQTTHGVAWGSWVTWTAGTGWLSQLFYDYWLYTGDRRFLAERAVPFMKQVALFYEDWLVEGPDGKLFSAPSLSPEHPPGNQESMQSVNALMDFAVAREVLANLCTACELLGIEADGVRRWRAMLDKLPDYMIDDRGALKEWLHPNLANDDEHRHHCGLYPVFPGYEITVERHPAMFEAARRAMEFKLPKRRMRGWCAWSYVLAANIWARLEDGDQAVRTLDVVARDCYALANLFSPLWPADHHLPPMYQFEASSGVTAAITDMLLYSEPGMIKLLPALPRQWPKGSVKGLRTRCRAGVDTKWDIPKGRLEATIVSDTAQRVTVKFPSEPKAVRLNGPGSIGPSGLGTRYRMLDLPKAEPVTMTVRLAQ